MKMILSLLSLLSSCATVGTVSPVDAGVPNLKFWYWKSDSYVLVSGQGSDRFAPGEPKRFKVETTGKCLIRYIDGDSDMTKPCAKEVYFDFGDYQQTSPEVASLVVISGNGSRYGVFYPNFRQQRGVLPLEFKCPQQNTTQGVSTCARPAGYKFQYTVKTSEPGKLLYTKRCVGSGTSEEVVDLKEPVSKSFSTDSDRGHCAIGFAFKGASGVASAHVMHVAFYDQKYTPVEE